MPQTFCQPSDIRKNTALVNTQSFKTLDQLGWRRFRDGPIHRPAHEELDVQFVVVEILAGIGVERHSGMGVPREDSLLCADPLRVVNRIYELDGNRTAEKEG